MSDEAMSDERLKEIEAVLAETPSHLRDTEEATIAECVTEIRRLQSQARSDEDLLRDIQSRASWFWQIRLDDRLRLRESADVKVVDK